MKIENKLEFLAIAYPVFVAIVMIISSVFITIDSHRDGDAIRYLECECNDD